MKSLDQLQPRLKVPGRTILSGLPEGLDALVLPKIAREVGTAGLVHVCRDDQHLAALEEQLEFFDPALTLKRFPAWDCLPYDRVSPSADVLSRRLSTLAWLAQKPAEPFILLTTVNAVSQRVLTPALIAAGARALKPGNRVDGEKLQNFLIHNGYSRNTLYGLCRVAVGGFANLFGRNARSQHIESLNFGYQQLLGSMWHRTTRTTDTTYLHFAEGGTAGHFYVVGVFA